MTLYEMLAGRLPWAASTTEFKVLTLKSRGDFPPPTDFYPEIPEVVLRALNGALAVELEDRFTNVGAFRRALEGAALEGAALAAPAVVAAQAPKAEAEPVPASVPVPKLEAAIEAKGSRSTPWSFIRVGLIVIVVLSIVAKFFEVEGPTNITTIKGAPARGKAMPAAAEKAMPAAAEKAMPAVKSWQPPKTENAVYYKTSYPCENSTQADEFAICENPTLARLDLEMADKYKAVKRHTNNRSALISAQRQTLNERRKCGDDIICIQSVVSTRILFLEVELAIRGL
jgi:hypothetical protein